MAKSLNLGLRLVRNDLFPVYETGQHNRAVSLRDVWAALDSGKDFSSWAKAKLKEHRLAEGKDYIADRAGINALQGEKSKGRGRRPVEYILPLRTAKMVAMGVNTAAGDRVKEYFLLCEEVAQAAVAASQKPAPAPRRLTEFADRAVQVECVKEVGKALYLPTNNPEPIIGHHRAVALALTGKKPSAYVRGFVKQGLRVASKSAREVMRRFEPAKAATAAFLDDAVARGKSLAQLESAGVVNALPQAFSALLAAGYSQDEIEGMV